LDGTLTSICRMLAARSKSCPNIERLVIVK
jgi:hypothetical protein